MTATNHHPVARVPAGAYVVDPNASTVEFSTRHWFGLHGVTGSFTIVSGTVGVPEHTNAVTASVSIDSASFTTTNKVRNRTVLKQFLDAEHHPTIEVTVDRVEQNADVLTGFGTITARGGIAPVEMAITDIRADGNTMYASLAARVDRYAHGITKARGMAAQHLDVVVRLVANRPT